MRAKRAKVSERSELRRVRRHIWWHTYKRIWWHTYKRIWWHTYKRIWWHTYKRIWCLGGATLDTHINAFGAWHTYKRGPWNIPQSSTVHLFLIKTKKVVTVWTVRTRWSRSCRAVPGAAVHPGAAVCLTRPTVTRKSTAAARQRRVLSLEEGEAHVVDDAQKTCACVSWHSGETPETIELQRWHCPCSLIFEWIEQVSRHLSVHQVVRIMLVRHHASGDAKSQKFASMDACHRSNGSLRTCSWLLQRLRQLQTKQRLLTHMKKTAPPSRPNSPLDHNSHTSFFPLNHHSVLCFDRDSITCVTSTASHATHEIPWASSFVGVLVQTAPSTNLNLNSAIQSFDGCGSNLVETHKWLESSCCTSDCTHNSQRQILSDRSWFQKDSEFNKCKIMMTQGW